MQGQFGATLPAVNVGAPATTGLGVGGSGYGTQAHVFKNKLPTTVPIIPSPSTAPVSPTAQMIQNLGVEGLDSYMNKLRPPEEQRQDDFATRQQDIKQTALNNIIAQVEAGDMSSLKYLPAEDLEAMGLAEFAAAGAGGSGIGTGIDEGRDMTPAQLEERYYRNKEVEAQLLSSKRWNEQKNKFETVGEYLRRERGKYNKKGRRKGGAKRRAAEAAAQQQAAPEPQNPQFTVQQYGVVNFNTATG